MSMCTETVTEGYIIPRMLSEKYSDIICYGIGVEQTVTNGEKTEHRYEQIDNAFFRYEDALEFIKYICERKTSSYHLREMLERFTHEMFLKRNR